MRVSLISMLVALIALASAQADNLAPNPGFDEPDVTGRAPLGWENERGGGQWTTDEVRSGERSLKLVSREESTRLWTSEIIPVEDPETQFVLSVWAKLEAIEGPGGAMMVLYHIDEHGERIGQSANLYLRGSTTEPATDNWRQHFAASELTPEVRGVRINLRLNRASGTVWFDDVDLREMRYHPIEQPVPLRRGLDLTSPEGIGIITAEGADAPAGRILEALRARGVTAEVLSDDVDLLAQRRDLIVLGNLATSRACEFLYRNYYSFEDLYYPGPGGMVLRPVIDPFGTGVNLLVLGASDTAGLERATDRLLEMLEGDGDTLHCDLQVEIGEGYIGHEFFPWPATTPWREIKHTADYHKSGDIAHAQTYRRYVLDNWFDPDHRDWNHLFYITKTLSWELMHTTEVFSDEERLRLTNELLENMRGDEGYGYGGLDEDRRHIRHNHATRAARAFYFGWRHFDRYYRDQMPAELSLWRRKMETFWTLCLSSSRSQEDSLSQHALGGSLDNMLDIALMEPEWSREFWASELPHRMGERCIAISNNMGQTVMVGSTGGNDYASSVFSKLAYALSDGRYQFMIGKRGATVTSTDESMRGFVTGVEPVLPESHIGLAIVDADDLYYRTELTHPMGVTLEETFDKLAFRSGFDPNDEYLMLDGMGGGAHSFDDVNSIGEFSANERRWLLQMDRLKGPALSFHNAVTVAQEGLGARRIGQAVKLTDSAEGDGWAYTATSVPRHNGVGWNRHVLWLSERLFFVLDEMVAYEPGDYSFVAGWRSIGEPELAPGVLEVRQDETPPAGIYLDAEALARDAVTSEPDVAAYRHGDLDALFVRTVEVGQRVTIPVEVPEPGDYHLRLTTVDVAGRGIAQVAIDGRPVGAPVDMYAEDLTVTDHELGTVTLDAGERTVSFEVVGCNEATSSYLMMMRSLQLATAEQLQQQRETRPNRFWLHFPPGQSATLDRDWELLGPDLPHNPHADPAINILEQSLSRELEPGEAACFQNAFHARWDRAAPEFELRRLTEHCALLRSEEGVALVGAGVEGASATIGALEVSGRAFYLGPDVVILHEARASVDGAPLEADAPLPAQVRQALLAAWEEAATEPEERDDAWAQHPPAQTLWSADLTARPRSSAARTVGGETRMAVGLEDGTVIEFDRAGETLGVFATGGPVHALHAADITGDGNEQLLVGSDDETLYVLDAAFGELWRFEAPFVRFGGIPMHWTLRAAKVRGLHTDDITGDGRAEVLVGTGSMHLHCLDADGRELWRTPVTTGARWTYGIPDTIVTADLYGEGRPRVLVGNGLLSYSSFCTVLDESGEIMQQMRTGGWAITLPAIAVADLDGDGRQWIVVGNNVGDVRCYQPSPGERSQRWWQNLSRVVRSFTVIPRDGGDLVAAGSDSGYLCAFDADGEVAWGVALSSGIPFTALLPGAAEPLLAASCSDGRVFFVTTDGSIASLAELGGRLEAMAVASLYGGEADAVVAVTSNPHRIHLLRPDLE